MSNTLEPNFNGLPKPTDWNRVTIPLQQANEKEFRGASLPELSANLKIEMSVNAQRIPSVPPGALVAGPADREVFMEIKEPGSWTWKTDPPLTNAQGDISTFWWNKTDWEKNDRAALPTAPVSKVSVVGKNKVKLSRITANRLVSSSLNGGVISGAGFKVIVIPIGALLGFTISGWESARTEIAFFKGDVPAEGTWPNNANLIKSGPASLLGLIKEGDILYGSTPDLTTFIAINIRNATEADTVYSFLQLELGNVVTAYEAYTEKDVVSAVSSTDIAPTSILLNGELIPTSNIQLKTTAPQSKDHFTYDNTGSLTTMRFTHKGKIIQHTFKTKRVTTLDASNVFDWSNFSVDGTNRHTQSDDNAPVRINGWTVGGNHGYRRYNITSDAHGKTSVDVGSIWTDGINQWVIVGIPSANVIAVSHRTENLPVLAVNTLTHVSGATNIGNINSTVKAPADFYPPNKNYSLKVIVNNELVTTNTVIEGEGTLTFIESYDIMLKSGIMQWYIDNVGSIVSPIQPNAASIARITNTYTFDTKMVCHTQQSFEALNTVELPFQDIMFLMANVLTVSYKVYIPKSLPFIHGVDSYDFRVPMSYNRPTSYRINFTMPRIEKGGILADRAILMASNENLGFAMGFLTEEDATVEKRRKLVNNKAMQFNENGKVYLSGVDSSDIVTMILGDVYKIEGYKAYFFKEGNRTANYVISTPQGNYYYFDWHTAGIDRIELPDRFQIIEKSQNISMISSRCVSVSINTANPYGYLIAKG